MRTDPARGSTVLVTGATGRLGLLVDLLIARGHTVRAMTRAPNGRDAARLRRVGAHVVYGDFEDRDSIAAAARGADAIFATGTAHRAGPEGELRHGRNVAEAAARADVRLLVYGSGDGASEDSPVPLFRVKHQVEERIRALGVPHTVLAPVYLMENLFNPWNLPALRAGTFPSPIPVEAPLQQLALADLAAFAALAIERREEFMGRRVSLAADELSAEQAAAVISSATCRPLRARRLRSAELSPGLRTLFAWLTDVGHHVDIAALRSRYPDVGWHRYADWARSQRSRIGDTSGIGPPACDTAQDALSSSPHRKKRAAPI
jgi:uncharacterized protein YbjT (DUF2867 family)